MKLHNSKFTRGFLNPPEHSLPTPLIALLLYYWNTVTVLIVFSDCSIRVYQSAFLATPSRSKIYRGSTQLHNSAHLKTALQIRSPPSPYHVLMHCHTALNKNFLNKLSRRAPLATALSKYFSTYILLRLLLSLLAMLCIND